MGKQCSIVAIFIVSQKVEDPCGHAGWGVSCDGNPPHGCPDLLWLTDSPHRLRFLRGPGQAWSHSLAAQLVTALQNLAGRSIGNQHGAVVPGDDGSISAACAFARLRAGAG